MDTADVGYEALFLIMVFWALLACLGFAIGLWDMKHHRGGRR